MTKKQGTMAVYAMVPELFTGSVPHLISQGNSRGR